MDELKPFTDRIKKREEILAALAVDWERAADETWNDDKHDTLRVCAQQLRKALEDTK